MSDEAPSTIPADLQNFGLLDILQPTTRDDYKYNYTYLAPLAMAQSVPRADKPSLAWMLRVVWQVLRIAKNRVTWAVNTGRAASPGDEVLTFSGHEDVMGSTTLNLDHLNLPALDLISTNFDDEPQMIAVRADADGVGQEEVLSFSEPQATIREGFGAHAQATEIASKMLAFGIYDPLKVLETVLRSLIQGPTGRPSSLNDYHALFATLPKPWIAGRPNDDELFA